MSKSNWSAVTGAAFLMAISAIGPGFLTQTAVFTAQLGASFACIILLSVLIDAIAQLNIWRVIAIAELPAQVVANKVLPGLGHFLAFLVFLGGLAFNIGNLGGAGLGLNVLFGLDVTYGAAISAAIAIGIFLYREAGKVMDVFVKLLGTVMIALVLFIAYRSQPPVAEALYRSIAPNQFSFSALLTIVGGTVGGYITFAGAHRLLDARITGRQHLRTVNRGAVSAIGIASLMRVLLFLAALGVVSAGHALDPNNPPASVFQLATGNMGYAIFGLVMWAAAITSVVGSAYTSLSFVKTFHPSVNRHIKPLTGVFIVASCTIYAVVGQPVKTLIVVGALNGLILPLALATMLVAAHRPNIVGDYRQPLWLTGCGAIVVLLMTWMSGGALLHLLAS